MVRENHAADRLHDGNLGEIFGAAPAVERQRKRLSDPRIVKRLAALVRRCKQNAVPVAFLDRDLVAQGFHQIVTSLRREAAELDRRAVAANGLQAQRHLRRGNSLVTIQIGFSLVMVTGVFLAFDEGARLMLHEAECTGAIDVLLMPGIAVLIEVLLRIDEVERHGDDGMKDPDGKFSLKVTSYLPVDSTLSTILKKALRAEAMPFGGKMTFLKVAVMSSAVSGVPSWNFTSWRILKTYFLKPSSPFGTSPSHRSQTKSVGEDGIVGIDPDQRRVKRPDRMDHAEGTFDMPVIGRDFGADHKAEHTARLHGLRRVSHTKRQGKSRRQR